MVVLAVARVRVDVQRGDLPVAGRVGDGPGLHLGRPPGAFDLVVAHAEHLLGHAHHEAQALLRREVGAEGLVVDGVAVAQQALRVEHRVPALQPGHLQRLAQVARLRVAQLGRVAPVVVGDGRVHVVQELRGPGRRLHHAPAQHELVVAGQAEQLRLLQAQLLDLGQQLQVVGAALVRLRAPQALARARILGRLHRGGVGRAVDGQRDLAVGVARLVLPHLLRHALQLGLGERDAGAGVADVAVELLAQPRQLVRDGLGASLLVLGQGHAGVLERLQRELRGALVDRILERGHRLPGAIPDERVQAQGRLEIAPALVALLGLCTHLGVGMHVLEEDQRAALVFLPVVERLPALEPVGTGLALLELLDTQHRALEARGAGRGHLRAAIELREGQVRDRVLDHRLDGDGLGVDRGALAGRRACRRRRQGQDGRQRQRGAHLVRSLHRVSGIGKAARQDAFGVRPDGRAIVTVCRANFRARCDELQIYRPETLCPAPLPAT